MTNDEILDLARKGYKEMGLVPARVVWGDQGREACVLGAACRALGRNAGMSDEAAQILDIPVSVAWGCMDSFDSGRTECVPAHLADPVAYRRGFDLGVRARKEFLHDG